VNGCRREQREKPDDRKSSSIHRSNLAIRFLQLSPDYYTAFSSILEDWSSPGDENVKADIVEEIEVPFEPFDFRA
jgi:hypothetical protein